VTWRAEKWRVLARSLKIEAQAIYLVSRDPTVPWYARVLSVCVLAYLLSPIDLVPDFLPIVGHLDDLIVVPAGLWLVIRLIPPEVMAEHRVSAQHASLERKPSWIAAGLRLF
jgi:uncharacterized membrane protein YkvA (DUF1232 family)